MAILGLGDIEHIPQVKGHQNQKWQQPPIKDLHITEHGVHKLIDGINTSEVTSKSSGPDGIPGKLLQSLANELAPVLRFIFEQSLLTGDLPVDWT